MTIINPIDLDTLYLDKGDHDSPEDGMCAVEAAAFVAGEPFSDHPECVSPVIGAFLRSWNDALDDDTRQTLKQYVFRLVGSAASPDVEDARAWLCLDWLVHTYTPAWLRLAKLDVQAVTLEGLPEFKAGMDVSSIRPAIDSVRKDAAAAYGAARTAASAAAYDAACAAAYAAARAAAYAAACAAAYAAAYDAAYAAAYAGACTAAYAAADDAARAALQPTVTQLQDSTHDLVDRMLTLGASA